jgi:hypothetical protein
MAARPSGASGSKDTTPDKWAGPKDAREIQGAGTYPNYYSHKTRSGHVFLMDDSDGSESVTLQHRSGSMVQFLPDGVIQFVAHNGQYTFTFGENRVHITGAYDVTVQGAASMRVEKDFNVTVQGNMNTTVNGDYNMTAKNMNTVIRGNMDTSAKNMTTKIEGSTEITTEGVTSIASDGGLSLSSSGEGVSILGQGDVGLGSEGKVMIDAAGSMDLKAGGVMRKQSGGKMSLKAGGIVGIDGSQTWIQSGRADSAEEMVVSIPPPKNPNFGGPR